MLGLADVERQALGDVTEGLTGDLVGLLRALGHVARPALSRRVHRGVLDLLPEDAAASPTSCIVRKVVSSAVV